MTDISKHSVVLLSAGVGRRLGKLGISKPKCLLKFKKTTLLEKIIITLTNGLSSNVIFLF